MKYQLIKQPTYEEFTIAVNNFVTDGWEPNGEFQLVKVDGNPVTWLYLQVMVKW